jgi:uncharacterized protein YndB with AHSA1/START domain
VWRAWTDPGLLPQWFCPRPWQTVEVEMDLRPGGAFNAVLQGPDGERMPVAGCYLVVDAPHRLVWTSALHAGFQPAPETPGVPAFTCILTFDAVDGGTHYTARLVHRDVDGARAHAEMGFHDGWGKALTQLVDAVKGHVAES